MMVEKARIMVVSYKNWEGCHDSIYFWVPMDFGNPFEEALVMYDIHWEEAKKEDPAIKKPEPLCVQLAHIGYFYGED